MTVVQLGFPIAVRSGAADAPGSPAPADGPLRDSFGRVARDLRVSVTDRCNLRCTYCMPADGLDWLASERVLTTGEFIRVLTVAVRDLGIRSIRFTGGEPLLRRDLEEIIGAVSALPAAPDIALTTNGLGLAKRAERLAAAGLRRINVSLDTVDAARFTEITRRDRLDDVIAGLEAARSAGLAPIKVNAVLPDRSDLARLPDLLRFCLDRGYELRIIENMPLDAEHRWDRSSMVTADEILTTLRSHFRLRPDVRPRGSAPAATWLVGDHVDDAAAPRVGVIASVTKPFCGDCDRTRLTADGALRNCLFADSETSLIPILRAPDAGSAADVDATDVDAAIARAWRADMWRKRSGHGVNEAGFTPPDRPMSAIGG